MLLELLADCFVCIEILGVVDGEKRRGKIKELHTVHFALFIVGDSSAAGN